MLRGPGIRACLLAALMVVCGVAVASDRFEMLMAEVTINRGDPQPAFVLRDQDNEFWFEESLADAHRINGQRPDTIEYRGVSFLPLAGFEGGEAEFDQRTVRLDIRIPPQFLKGQVRTIRQASDPAASSATGVFLDYDMSYFEGSADERELFSTLLQPTLFGRQGVVRNAVLYRSSSYDEDDSRDPDFDFGRDEDPEAGDGWIRLETTFVKDDPEHLRSFRAGDSILEPGMLGTVARFGGIQLATNFSTRPQLVTFPLPRLAGEALLDSSIDLYVDGRRTRTESVLPGPFQLDEIPVSTGGGEIRMVTRDLTGRQQVVTTDFYVSQRSLRKGLTEYSYGLGALRRDYGIDSNDYGDLVASGFHRYGYSDQLTLEGQIQTSTDVQRTGIGATFTRPRFGVASVGVGLSNADGPGAGYELLAAHEFRSRRLRMNSSLRYTSEDYRQINIYRDAARPKWLAAMGGGFVFDRYGSLSATLARREFHDSSATNLASASYSKSFRSNLSLVAYGTYLDGEDSDFTVGLSVTRFLGGRRSASIDIVRDDDGTRLLAESRASLPRGPGLGYRFAAGMDDGDEVWVGGASLNTRVGRYSAGADHDEDGTNWRASAAGSAAWIGGMPFLTREIRDAFAVVQVNGFEGVEVKLDNQSMGRTDSSGRILLPGLRPFQENRVRIEIEDLPLNARIDKLETSVTPYAGAGILADFPASEGRDLLLRLVMPDGSPAPQGGYVLLEASDVRHPVGLDGAIYLREVTDGDLAQMRWQDQRCGFTVRVPESAALVPRGGDVVCNYYGVE